MANRYGLTEAQRTLSTQPFDLWSGAFMNTWEASGVARTGARSVTLTTYNGDKVKAHLPAGVTFPRTAENYRDIDAALSDALAAYYLQGRSA